MRNPDLLTQLHLGPKRCDLDPDHDGPYSLHHIHKHPRDDLIANLMWLCGDGTTGCHGLIEHNDHGTLVLLQRHLLLHRHDFLRYVQLKLGHEQGWAWVMALSESKLGT